MKEVKLPNHTIKDSEGKERPKTIHDYTGEELEALYEQDPDLHEKLWEDAEIEAINNPENHDKSN